MDTSPLVILRKGFLSLKQRLVQAEQNLHSAHEDNSRLQIVNSRLEGEKEKALDQLAKVEEQKKELVQQLGAATATMGLLREQNDWFAEKMEEALVKIKNLREFPSSHDWPEKEEHEDLKVEDDRLAAELDKLQQEIAQYTDVEKQNADLREQLGTMEWQLKCLTSEEHEWHLESELERIKARVRELGKKLYSAETKLAIAVEDNQRLVEAANNQKQAENVEKNGPITAVIEYIDRLFGSGTFFA